MKINKDDAIVVDHVYKTFNVYLDKANSFKERILFWKRNKKDKREVLKNINLSIKKGESVALIGVNGSGKSTLLKLMTKIIYPNKGKIVTNGKLTSLLELGAGFHPDFSGRENIYFNASIFGLTKKEIDKRIDDINTLLEAQYKNYIDLLEENSITEEEKTHIVLTKFTKPDRHIGAKEYINHALNGEKVYIDRHHNIVK